MFNICEKRLCRPDNETLDCFLDSCLILQSSMASWSWKVKRMPGREVGEAGGWWRQWTGWGWGGGSVRRPLTSTKGISSCFKNRWEQKHFALSPHSRRTIPMLMRRLWGAGGLDGILLLRFDTSASLSPFVTVLIFFFSLCNKYFSYFLKSCRSACSWSWAEHSCSLQDLSSVSYTIPSILDFILLTHLLSVESNSYQFYSMLKLSCPIWTALVLAAPNLILGEHFRNMKPSPLTVEKWPKANTSCSCVFPHFPFCLCSFCKIPLKLWRSEEIKYWGEWRPLCCCGVAQIFSLNLDGHWLQRHGWSLLLGISR